MKWPPTSPPLALFDFISLWQLGMEGVVKVAMPAPFTAVVTSPRPGLQFPDAATVSRLGTSEGTQVSLSRISRHPKVKVTFELGAS